LAPADAVAAIDTSNKTAVTNAYRNIFLPTQAVTSGWTGSAATCTPGTVSTAFQNATFTAVNYFRAMAGLPNVTENTTASAIAARTALMMQAHNDGRTSLELNHFPPNNSNWPCWTNNGAFTASISNLSIGRGGSDGYGAGASAVASYVGDGGNETVVGHRRWVLSPGQQTMGSGSTNHANVLVWGSGQSPCLFTGPPNQCVVTSWDTTESPSFTTTRTSSWTSPTFVAWPSKGYFPYQLLDDNDDNVVWSLATGTNAIGFSNATVTMTKNGSAISGITLKRRDAAGTSGYGDRGAIIWQPPASVYAQPAQGETITYHVKISGITGYSGGVYEYDVKVYNPAEATVASVSISGTAAAGSTLTANVGARTPSDATLSYVWYRDGSTVIGYSNTYEVKPADAGRQITLKVTPSKDGWTSFPKTSAAVTVAALPTVSGNVIDRSGASVAGLLLNYDNVDCTTHYDIRDPFDVWNHIVLTAGGAFSVSLPAGECLRIYVSGAGAGSSFATTWGSTTTLYHHPVAGTSGIKLYFGTAPTSTPTPTKTTTSPKPSTSTPAVAGPTTATATPRTQGYTPSMDWFTLSPDLNGDGRGEVLVTKAATGQLLDYPATATGALGGAKTLVSSGLTGQRVYGPGDWNGDGFADVVAVDKSGYMWLYAGNGNGTVRSRVEIGHGWTPFRIIPAGDLTQDGANDMLAIDSQGRLWLYSGNGKGGWKGLPKQVGQGWVGLELYAAGDLNADGKNDILAILPDSTLWAYSGRGNGTFDVPRQVGRGWGAFELAAGADLNGDGRADIVGRNNSTGELFYYRGNGGGSFQAAVRIATGW
jgi:hypothetical protein